MSKKVKRRDKSSDTPATKGDVYAVQRDVDQLAVATKASFDLVDQRFDKVDQRFDNVESDIATLKSDVTSLKRGQAAILNVVTSIDERLQEWKDIPERVERLEKAAFPT